MASSTTWIWCALLAWSGLAAAQSISPANATTANGLEHDGLDDSIQLAIAHRPDSMSITVFPVAGLTTQAQHYTPNDGFRGPILLANASSQLSLDAQDVAFISCDPYSGNIQPSNVFGAAQDANVSAIVLYSERAAGCMINSSPSDFDRVYSMRTSNSTKEMLDLINTLGTSNGGQSSYAIVAPRDAVSDGSVGNSSAPTNDTGPGSQQQNPLGPSPSTAVAMIILYAITGVITALFLVIIITGAVRAHRHPERYGPRNGIGRPRQSRARGLAMAMLETIPIVKFGDRPAQDPKASDVELAEGGRHGEVEVVAGQDAIRAAPNTETGTEEANKDGTHERSREPETPAAEGGIGGAVATGQPNTNEENQGCSICTEDFQLGEDQRVLPCDHRFHPACIDPWLLNVSGTCPLCRIDLRPEETTEEGPQNPDHVLREGEPGEMPPPLAEQNDRRASVRRSILQGIMGVGRPERMSREERIAALRRYRAQRDATRVAERRQSANGASNLEPVGESAEEEQEEETSVRRRLRNAFRIRTRRTGEDEGVDRRREGTFAGGVGRA